MLHLLSFFADEVMCQDDDTVTDTTDAPAPVADDSAGRSLDKRAMRLEISTGVFAISVGFLIK